MPSLPPNASRSQRNQQTPRLKTKERGYGGDWRKLREVFLQRYPLCVHCLRSGLAMLATEVDHIRPINDGGARLDPSNLQSLCKPCHMKKHRQDR